MTALPSCAGCRSTPRGSVYSTGSDKKQSRPVLVSYPTNDDPRQVAHYEYDPYGRLIHIDNNVYDRYGNYVSANGYALDKGMLMEAASLSVISSEVGALSFRQAHRQHTA